MAESSNTIDGNLLVIRDKTALPQRCVQTNEPVSVNEYTTWDLPYIPIWLMIVMIASPLFLVFTQFAVRRRCHLRAGLSRSVRRRFFLLKFGAASIILLSIISPVVCITSGSTELAMLSIMLFLPLFWGGFAILILGTSPLRIVRHSSDRFWIKGCSQVFLSGLQTVAPSNNERS
jgi:hypothetical protein